MTLTPRCQPPTSAESRASRFDHEASFFDKAHEKAERLSSPFSALITLLGTFASRSVIHWLPRAYSSGILFVISGIALGVTSKWSTGGPQKTVCRAEGGNSRYDTKYKFNSPRLTYAHSATSARTGAASVSGPASRASATGTQTTSSSATRRAVLSARCWLPRQRRCLCSLAPWTMSSCPMPAAFRPSFTSRGITVLVMMLATPFLSTMCLACPAASTSCLYCTKRRSRTITYRPVWTRPVSLMQQIDIMTHPKCSSDWRLNNIPLLYGASTRLFQSRNLPVPTLHCSQFCFSISMRRLLAATSRPRRLGWRISTAP